MTMIAKFILLVLIDEHHDIDCAMKIINNLFINKILFSIPVCCFQPIFLHRMFLTCNMWPC